MSRQYIQKTGRYLAGGLKSAALVGALLLSSMEAKAQDQLSYRQPSEQVVSTAKKGASGSEEKNGALYWVFGDRQKITLSLDYLENTRKKLKPDFNFEEAAEILKSSINYTDFLSNAKQAVDRKAVLSLTGSLAAAAYDYSYPSKRISYDRVFRSTKTGDPSGAICGGIHKFLATTAEQVGFPAVDFTGRFYEKGRGHISSIFYSSDGFYGLDYGDMLRTGTHNLEKALRAIQENQGRTAFRHELYRNGDFLNFWTEDGKTHLRFWGADPSSRRLEATMDGDFSPAEDKSELVFGNRELSFSRDFGENRKIPTRSIYSLLRLKAGVIDGVPDSGLERSYNAMILYNACVKVKNESLEISFSPQAGLLYSFLQEKGGDKNSLGIMMDLPVSCKRKIYEDFYAGGALRFFGVIDPISVIKNGFSIDGISEGPLWNDVKADAGLCAGKGPAEVYGIIEVTRAYDRPDSQNLTIQPTGFFGGLRYKAENTGTFRLEAGEKSGSLFGGCRFEGKGFEAWVEAGKGRMEPFTADVYLSGGLRGEIDFKGLKIEGSVAGDYKKWSRGENSFGGSANLSFSIDGAKRLIRQNK